MISNAALELDLGFFTISPVEYKAVVDVVVATVATVWDVWVSVVAALSEEHPAIKTLAMTSIVSIEIVLNDSFIDSVTALTYKKRDYLPVEWVK